MRKARLNRSREQSESGAALLIAIFALLLISVVAIALVVTQGTDSALAGNYRTSISGYYAAMAGLEEARGRLSWKNPNCFVTSPNSTPCANSGFIPMAGTLPNLALTDVRYILNPASGETVDPTSSTPANYPDVEYQQEFGWSLSGTNVQTVASVWTATGSNGPEYKWVRINPVTEHALNLDVNYDGTYDTTTPLLYDPANVDSSYNPRPGLVFPTTPPAPTAVQALEITALAVMPNGSQRILQYVVTPFVLSTQVSSPGGAAQNFPAALTLAGTGVNFAGPETASFFVNGQDQCTGSNLMEYSVGFTNSTDQANITAAATPAANYKGYPASAPGPPAIPSSPGIGNIDVNPATAQIRPSLLTPGGLDSLVQDITKSADVVLNGPVNGNTSLTPLGMTANNPLTVVINGDLDLTSWHQVGYGLLLVTGTLTYDPDATWEGVVLVIGQGNFVSTKSGTGGIDGAVFVAKTRDSSGNLLASLGRSSFSQTGSGGNLGRGINFNSCLSSGAATAQAPLSYKVLSFREIPVN